MAKDKNVVTTLPADEHLALKIKAARADKPISQILRELLRKWLSGDSPSEDSPPQSEQE